MMFCRVADGKVVELWEVTTNSGFDASSGSSPSAGRAHGVLPGMRTMVQRLAASAAGSWLLARTLHHLDRLALAVSGGRWSLTGILTGSPVVVVTTTGARSGRLRRTPLLGIRDRAHPGAFALVASNWGQRHHPAWYFNLKAHPEALCAVAGQSGPFVAHEAWGDEYDRFWRYAADTYPGYPLYRQRAGGRRIPILVMIPVRP